MSRHAIRDGDQLSEREAEVLRGLTRGQSNLTIGHELYLSEHTVKVHVRRLFIKLGARDRPHAVALAFARGVLAADPVTFEVRTLGTRLTPRPLENPGPGSTGAVTAVDEADTLLLGGAR